MPRQPTVDLKGGACSDRLYASVSRLEKVRSFLVKLEAQPSHDPARMGSAAVGHHL